MVLINQNLVTVDKNYGLYFKEFAYSKFFGRIFEVKSCIIGIF